MWAIPELCHPKFLKKLIFKVLNLRLKIEKTYHKGIK